MTRTDGAPMTDERGTLRAASELAPGAAFAGRYTVEALLGRGAMGVVYRVFDRHVESLVALKVLALGAEPDAVERFRREVRLARSITSKHVARIHDLGEHAGTHFLTMELVDGPSLEARLEGGPLEPARAVRLARQIALGLDAAHAEAVVHRDLKPANVLVERWGEDGERAVLTDFGIARALRDARRTHEGHVLVGTPAYMAPEQVLGETVDARTDVYALGMTLYEMLTGTVPFLEDAATPLAVALARCSKAPADPRSFRPVPDPLAELVLACLALVPEHRPESAAAVASALERWLDAAVGGRRLEARAAALGDTVVAPRAPSLAAHPSSTAPSPVAVSPSQTPPSQLLASSPLAGRDASMVGGASSSGPFAPLPELSTSLAVLPFRVRGGDDPGGLADGLHESLIDVLSRIRGLRVASSGVVERYREERDPTRVGAALGVDALVDGSMQLSGDRLRVTVRLLDARTGVQRWSERLDAAIADALSLEDTLGSRIAEALRMELTTVRPGSTAPREAVELYLAARREMRSGDLAQWGKACEMLQQALALAPDFGVAAASLAIARLRAWWMSAERGRDWPAEVAADVARAQEVARDYPETHLAEGMLAVQGGDLAAGVAGLARALELAPTFADAHTYLGELQCEAGRVDEGARRLRFALELEPHVVRPHFALARVAALRGDDAAVTAHLDVVDRARGPRSLGYLALRVRLAAWRRDSDALRALVESHAGDPDMFMQGMVMYGRYVLGDIPSLGATVELARQAGNSRMRALIAQLNAEAFGLRGDHDGSLEMLRIAAGAALVDVDWLERCPALEGLRGRAEYVELAAVVRARASALWSL